MNSGEELVSKLNPSASLVINNVFHLNANHAGIKDPVLDGDLCGGNVGGTIPSGISPNGQSSKDGNFLIHSSPRRTNLHS